MIHEAITNGTNLGLIAKSLDAGMLRARVISNNIANATTPEYKRIDVSFEEQLKKALNNSKLKGVKTNDAHLPLGGGDISSVKALAYRPNDPALASGVNNVDIDSEMSKLAQNQIMYNYGLKFLKGAYAKLNAAFAGRPIQQ
jgi:flagellar basal-body rod protein FlgB